MLVCIFNVAYTEEWLFLLCTVTVVNGSNDNKSHFDLTSLYGQKWLNRFGSTWGWVKYDKISGWTIPLKPLDKTKT